MKGIVGQLAAPLVLDLFNLALRVGEDLDHALDGLLGAETFDDVAGLEVHADGVARVGDLVVQALNLLEGRLQAVLCWPGIRYRSCCSLLFWE